jgi:ligand-binding sensor domain-containing protein
LQLALLSAIMLGAEQLPVKTYITADGLARNNVNCIVQDARGFLWFCAGDWLSRFDGYTFVNYGIKQGLPNRSVTSLCITRKGVYWVGTWVGLFRLDSNSPPPQKFEAVRVSGTGDRQRIYALVEDQTGVLWAGTDDGLYRLDAGKSEFQPVALGIPRQLDGRRPPGLLLEDHRGALWITSEDTLYRRMPDGNTRVYKDSLWSAKIRYVAMQPPSRAHIHDASRRVRISLQPDIR